MLPCSGVSASNEAGRYEENAIEACGSDATFRNFEQRKKDILWQQHILSFGAPIRNCLHRSSHRNARDKSTCIAQMNHASLMQACKRLTTIHFDFKNKQANHSATIRGHHVTFS